MKNTSLLLSILCSLFFCIACSSSNSTDVELEQDICVTDPQNSLCQVPEEDPVF